MTKSCLLIIPKHFYSFKNQFKKNLENLNYTVTVANDEYPENIVGLLLGKLRMPFIKEITYHRLKSEFIDGKKYDLVLIFKGRGINLELVNKLKEICPKVIGYNWDSFSFNCSPLKWYNDVTNYYTFDYKDSVNYNIPLVELFATEPIGNFMKEVKHKFSAIFRNHSNRLKYLECVIRHFEIKQDDILIYIYEQNIFFLLLNFVRSPALYVKYRKKIHFKPLSYNEYLDVLKYSCYTIDYAHPKQTGLTMRCFESLNTKTKIITNNAYINKCLCFTDLSPIVYNLKSVQNGKILDFSIDESVFKIKRTIADFLNDILK